MEFVQTEFSPGAFVRTAVSPIDTPVAVCRSNYCSDVDECDGNFLNDDDDQALDDQTVDQALDIRSAYDRSAYGQTIHRSASND